MKLVEIKNNFAKLYYRPNDVDLVISGFLTIDDGNQCVIAQVISSESTSQNDMNCAVLKFSLSLSEEDDIVAYNGYIPSLDAQVEKTDPSIVKHYFSQRHNSICLGEITSLPGLDLCLDFRLFEDFVYIQSDRTSNIQAIFNTLSTGIDSGLVIDTDGTINTESTDQFTLCEGFKLPVNVETLNYIYEHDLAGLQVEQKTVVQDIILEIQEYIKSEKRGFIPFSSLLSVVDDMYEKDKSIDIILFRNRLIKYNQNNIFASKEEEFREFFDALQGSGSISINLQHVNNHWKKQTIDFIINYCNSAIHLFMYIDDDLMDKDMLAKIYQKSNIRAILASKYSSVFANQIKSYAKNLIMFSPEEVQEKYPTYNSFLSKLSDEEFIVSGTQTLYTPIIVRPIRVKGVEPQPFNEIFEELESAPPPVKVSESSEEPEDSEDSETSLSDLSELVEEEEVEGIEVEIAQKDDETEIPDEPEIVEFSPIRDIFEDTVEAEIEQEFGETLRKEDAESKLDEDDVSYEDLFSDEDLDMLDDVNAGEEELYSPASEYSPVYEKEEENEIEEMISSEEGPLSGAVGQPGFGAGMPMDMPEESVSLNTPITDIFEEENSLSYDMQNKVMKHNPVSSAGVPVYKAVYSNESTRIDIGFAEGNIVFHPKYGRGVVEQVISYGKKTLCSIQFDNVGRRLLDPGLANLKQA